MPAHPAHARLEAVFDLLRTDAADTDREGEFPVRSLGLLRECGLLQAPLPAGLGGEGLNGASGAHALLRLLAAVGRAGLVLGRLYEGHVNALQLIGAFGTPAQQESAAADACAGHLFGVWNTEAADGLRLVEQQDGSRGSGGTLCLAGRKTFASGLGHVARALVTAARDDAGGRGWQMLVVATDRQRPEEDRSFWRPLGMRATASFAAGFDGIRVSASELIGAPGDYYREPAFSGGSVRFSAVQQGGIEAVFDETRRFLNGLGRTNDPYQRTRLGEMAWRVEAGRLWLDGAARHVGALLGAEQARGSGAGTRAAVPAEERAAIDPASAPRAADADAAFDAEHPAAAERAVAYARLMRSAIEDNAVRVLALADRSVGARGLLRPEPFERLHRDLTHYLRQPAPDAALAEAGRHVLDDGRPAEALWSPSR